MLVHQLLYIEPQLLRFRERVAKECLALGEELAEAQSVFCA